MVMLNAYGRAFIQESVCSPYGYSDDCGIEIAGITESFGDTSYLYCESSTAINDYDVIAQIEGSVTAPTTTITAYMPSDGKSQLLRMARKKCLFNLQIHYGECINPTDFSDFTYSMVFKDVRISSYTTTPLTSRSPDTRAIIDLTFNVSISEVVHLYQKEFTDSSTVPTVTTGAIHGVYAYNGGSCDGAECEDNCDVLAVQADGNAFNFVRKVDDTWYSDTLVAGVTPTRTSFIYTNGTNVYAFINQQSIGEAWSLYVSKYSDIAGTPTWTLLESGTSTVSPFYHVNGNILYFGSFSAGFYSLNTSSSSVSLLNSDITSIASVFGYGNTVYIGTGTGGVIKYNNGAVTAEVDVTGDNSTHMYPLSIRDNSSFIMYGSDDGIYCTTNGYSFNQSGTVGSGGTLNAINTSDNIYVLAGNADGALVESYDGGLTWTVNSTINITDFTPQSVTFCGDTAYVGGRDAANVVGNILIGK